jgi:hypothetical protein
MPHPGSTAQRPDRALAKCWGLRGRPALSVQPENPGTGLFGHEQEEKPLRLVVIEPVPYRNSKKSKLERREPVFLICTDLDLPLADLLQDFLWRWDIEVNFRDEKTILGVGQGQVRGEAANQNAPAVGVAAYALLLLAAIKTYGAEGRPDTFQSPLWYKRKPSTGRPPTS